MSKIELMTPPEWMVFAKKSGEACIIRTSAIVSISASDDDRESCVHYVVGAQHIVLSFVDPKPHEIIAKLHGIPPSLLPHGDGGEE